MSARHVSISCTPVTMHLIFVVLNRLKVMFVESICEDAAIIEQNIKVILSLISVILMYVQFY